MKTAVKPIEELTMEDCAAILALFVAQTLISEEAYGDLVLSDLDTLALARHVIALADEEYA